MNTKFVMYGTERLQHDFMHVGLWESIPPKPIASSLCLLNVSPDYWQIPIGLIYSGDKNTPSRSQNIPSLLSSLHEPYLCWRQTKPSSSYSGPWSYLETNSESVNRWLTNSVMKRLIIMKTQWQTCVKLFTNIRKIYVAIIICFALCVPVLDDATYLASLGQTWGLFSSLMKFL